MRDGGGRFDEYARICASLERTNFYGREHVDDRVKPGNNLVRKNVWKINTRLTVAWLVVNQH